MKRVLLIGAGLAVLAGSGAALAQMPPDGDGHGPGAREHWEMMRRMRHGRGGGAAAFRFKRGDTEIGIRCPAEEPVTACVSAASALIDKVAGLQPAKTP